MTAKEIRKLDYVNDGVRYTIHIEEAEDGILWGTWNCHDCDVGGSSTKKAATLDEAFEAAKDNLERHHTANHKL